MAKEDCASVAGRLDASVVRVGDRQARAQMAKIPVAHFHTDASKND